MQIVTVYLEEERERERRRKKRNVFALLAAAILSLLAAATVQKPPKVIKEVVYVPIDRTTLQYAEPLGPSAPKLPESPPPPTPAPAIEPPTEPTPAVRRPVRESRPPSVRSSPPLQPKEDIAPQPAPAPQQPPPQVAQTLKVLRPTIEPRQIHFVRSGAKRITISNPHPLPLPIRRIELARNEGGSPAGFVLEGEGRCTRTLRPKESCRFQVVSHGGVGAVTINLSYDPVVMREPE